MWRTSIRIVVVFACFLSLCLACEEDILLTALQAHQSVIAHRGSYQLHGYPENSRASLREALSLKIYGTEFDVRQTKDGVLVINHDEFFNGYEISKTSYQELISLSLNNGETISTLKEFLTIFKNSPSDVKLIVELKQCDVGEVVDLVKEFNLQAYVEYITFHQSYCNQLVQMGLGKSVLYLYGNLSPKEVVKFGYGWICYDESTVNAHPEWLSEAEELELKACMLWPVNDIEQMNNYANMGIHFFTDIPTVYNE